MRARIPALYRVLAVLPTTLALASPAHATNFCAGTVAELRAALSMAAATTGPHVIRIKRGVYAPPDLQSGIAAFQGSVNEGLTISGGWLQVGNLGCLLQDPTPGATVLDGLGARKVMWIAATPGDADLAIDHVTFRNGITNERGGGLHVSSVQGFDGDVRIELNRFLDNRSDLYGAGVSAGTAGQLVFRNNLLVGNRGGDTRGPAAELLANANGAPDIRAFVTHNTVVDSRCDASGTIPCDGAIRLGGSALAVFANNLGHGNPGFDFWRDADFEFVDNNGTCGSNVPPSFASGNVDLVSPGFVNAAARDYRLLRASPLRNAGTITYGIAATDLAGAPRVIDGPTDIGAFEDDSLFANGFEN